MKSIFRIGAFSVLLSLAAGQAAAQGKKDKKATKKSPVVGAYLVEVTTDTYVFPGTPDIPCPALIGNPSTPFVTSCITNSVSVYNSDGTLLLSGAPVSILATDADDDLAESEVSIGSALYGSWRANTRSTLQNRLVNVFYDKDGNAAGFRVSDADIQANADFSGLSGTFEARTYSLTQDPFDVNEVPTSTSKGTFVSRRITR